MQMMDMRYENHVIEIKDFLDPALDVYARLNEVQLLHESSGRPFFKLSGAAEKYSENEFDVSVTHTSELVIVTVVMNEV